MHTSCGEHWNSLLTQPVNIHLGADIYLATNLQAPSQTALEIWHLFNSCEQPFCGRNRSVSLTRHIEHPWEKIHRLLCYQILAKKDGKHLMGRDNNLRGTDLRVRGFDGCISESIGNLTFNILKRVTLSQWSHYEPWKDCFELFFPIVEGKLTKKSKSRMQCILHVVNIEIHT